MKPDYYAVILTPESEVVWHGYLARTSEWTYTVPRESSTLIAGRSYMWRTFASKEDALNTYPELRKRSIWTRIKELFT